MTGSTNGTVAWFERHGALAVLVGRLLPANRTLISVPAGIAGVKLPAFMAWTTAGMALWTALLTGHGYLLEGGYGEVANWANPVTNLAVAGLLFGYLYRIVTFRPHPVS